MEHLQAVAALVGIAGKGPQRDRTWPEAYEAGNATERVVDIDWVPEAHEALGDSFTDWIHRPDLWRGLAGCEVPVHFIAAGEEPGTSIGGSGMGAATCSQRRWTVPNGAELLATSLQDQRVLVFVLAGALRTVR